MIAAIAYALIMSVCIVLLVVVVRIEKTVNEKTDVIVETVAAMHEEVKTTNGLSIAALADRAEGRRILDDVLPADRTESEAGYVTNLEEGGRNPGHDGT